MRRSIALERCPTEATWAEATRRLALVLGSAARRCWSSEGVALDGPSHGDLHAQTYGTRSMASLAMRWTRQSDDRQTEIPGTDHAEPQTVAERHIIM
jgi:hypothetical protein